MRIFEVPGQAHSWSSDPAKPQSPASILAAKSQPWLGAVAFALPLLAVRVTDSVANAPGANAPIVLGMLVVCAASILVAATLCSSILMKIPMSLQRRLVLLAAAWGLLLVEVYCSLLWLQHGIH